LPKKFNWRRQRAGQVLRLRWEMIMTLNSMAQRLSLRRAGSLVNLPRRAKKKQKLRYAGLIPAMKRITIISIAIVTMVAGCFRPGIKGDGVIKTEDRLISDFTKVVIVGGYKVKWSSGKPALNISADQNLLPLIKTAVSGHTLRIDSQENLRPSKGITIILSSPSLADVRLNGGNSFQAEKISGYDLNIESTGASDITIDGSVTKLEANLIGASKLDAKSLQTKTATLSLVGASDANVTVSDTLSVSATGASAVTYSGNPKTVEKNITGAGSIRQRP
jgi:hypothetical protein